MRRDGAFMKSLIRDLGKALKGAVIASHDPSYDAIRVIFSGAIDRRPAVIVRPTSVADVSTVIRLVRTSGVALAVRSGGHSIHGTTDGGIVLDLRDMKSLTVNVDSRTAWADTGLTAGEYARAVGAHGLATSFGDSGSVGIGGITLGGGIGYLVRKHGLTIDSLSGAEVVTADGEVRQVNAVSHPDLFWAIRGGGGNFGVATRFRFLLQSVDQIVGGTLMLPATANVIADFVALAEAAPEELTTIANVMSAPPAPFVPREHRGKLVVLAQMCYAGDRDVGNKVLAPFRQLATPLADMLRPMQYADIYPPDDPSYHPTAVGRTMFIEHVDRDVANIILEYLRASDAVMRVAQLRVLGGAIARVPATATAFAHRHCRIMVNLAAFYEGAMERAIREAWVNDFATALQQRSLGAYVNYLNAEGGARVREAYPGATWERLSAIKARYDPENLFRLNENIPPATVSV